VSWLRKKNRKERNPGRETPSFGDWLRHSDVLARSLHPAKRVSHLLAEIQKRSLCDQSMIATLQPGDGRWEPLYSLPENEPAILPSDLIETICRRARQEQKILSLADLSDDPGLEQRFWSLRCRSILVNPFHNQEDSADILILVNPSDLGDESRLLDLIEYAGPLLTLALHNQRLYAELQQKDLELNDWAEHIEKRIEDGTKKLLERELQYHALFEGNNDGVVVHDRDGRILETNRASCRLFGYERKELLTLGWPRLADERHVEALSLFFVRTLRNDHAPPVEAVLMRKDGSLFDAEVNSRKVRFMGKEAVQSFIRDVSVRKHLEAGLQEEREKYRLLVESSLVGVFIIQQGSLRFVNTRFGEILQVTPEELVGQNYYEQVDPEERSMVTLRETRREMGEEVEEHYQVRYLRKDGTRCWCEIHCRRIEVEGTPSVMGNVLDISQRKLWESQLLETQKMESIGTLAGGIAHDFNNLLGGILGYASLLLTEMKEDHPYYQDLLAIAETAKKAADLTNRLLAFARGGKYQVSTLRINKLAEDVVGILRHSVDPSIIFETQLAKDLWAVKGDSRQIHQTFVNICLNSVDAMPGGGRIIISTENSYVDERSSEAQIGMRTGDYVLIRFRDTGVGMDERTKSRIFEPFFTTKPANERKGLGLSMVYGIVKNHNGTIQVQSELGRGTDLSIYFPRFIAAEPESDKSTGSVGSNKVLLVDDEEIIRHVGDRMLRKKGFDVLLAKNGREAVEVYEREKDDIAVVLMDLIMPEMDGKEAYKALKKINPKVKIVFTSGYGPHDRPDLTDGTGVLFLQKPFHTEILYQTIQSALGNGAKKIGRKLE
jgi:two-component system, cell cycle sensor histidine kinase and response regulator CckA